MRDLTPEEIDFTWPREIETLDAVPEIFRSGYAEADDRFKLHPEVQAEIEAGEERLQAQRAEHQAKIAELDAKLEQRTRQINELVGGAAIRRALASLPVKPGVSRGAEAFLLQNLKLNIAEGADGEPEVTVAGAYGNTTVEHAVRAWLETEGAAFRANKPDPSGGEYAQAMAALRRGMH